MMRKLIPVFLLMMIICSACKKETPTPKTCPEGYDFGKMDLSDEFKSFLPYDKYDSLFFENHWGDKQIFVLTDKERFYDEPFPNILNMHCEYSGKDEISAKYETEVLTYRFMSVDSLEEIEIRADVIIVDSYAFGGGMREDSTDFLSIIERVHLKWFYDRGSSNEKFYTFHGTVFERFEGRLIEPFRGGFTYAPRNEDIEHPACNAIKQTYPFPAKPALISNTQGERLNLESDSEIFICKDKGIANYFNKIRFSVILTDIK